MKKTLRGFTLIELVVVVAIMTIISAIILANYNHFGGEVVLQDTAYDMALSIRQAQVYGISVYKANGVFDVGYGMHFSSGSNTQYLLFADTVNQNGKYDNGEALQTSTIANGMTINKLYAPAAAPSSPGATCAGTSVSSLDILFIRPEPDAYISTNLAAASCTAPNATTNETCVPASGQTLACIVVADPKGDYKNILVYSNGQITVQ